ncbi:7816_t:CDS:2 [Cetraspora pellucida]|uniref:7816_t:CDS:1 n=1 Tax=Cetraspora pellucida TaxID=1433469 RepID=A0A9N9G720_9GLOM|nr:7816_t:CDS:2 [Cetraspora pellucida]
MQQKQLPTEDVDAYYIAIKELLYYIKAKKHYYSNTAKAQIFISGLRPNLATSVTLFLSKTLAAANERAKILLQQPNPTEKVIVKLTKAVNNMLCQLKDPSRRN